VSNSSAEDLTATPTTPFVSPFLSLVGAVGSPVAEHYGNPLGEQKALAAGRAIVDLSHRGVITVSGIDRLTWLDSLTSQSLARLAPGDSAETLLLDPTGRIEYAARVLDDGETTWLLLERDEAAGFAAWLNRMRFMLRVEVLDRSDEFATIGTLAPVFASSLVGGEPAAHVTGSVAVSVAGSITLPAAAPAGVSLVWRDPWATGAAGGVQYAAVDAHPAPEWTYSETLVARAALAALAETVATRATGTGGAAGATISAAGTLALEALRIAAWRPRLATEGDERSIPHELDWLRSAVHLNKGCYRGQETVAKVHNLGHPPRRLVMLHLDGSDAVLPEHGDPVVLASAVVASAGPVANSAAATAGTAGTAHRDADADVDVDSTAVADADSGAPAGSVDGHIATGIPSVGHVTSAAVHFELGPIALAVIKRSVDPAAELAVASQGIHVAAAQQVIVPTDAGAAANVPRLPRLGAVTR
jgi:tRNA-modifying protein YgfZ